MGKLVVIKLGKGDAAGNLPVIVQIGEDGSPFSAEIHGQLPADAQIVQQYTDWQTPYLSIQTGPRALGSPKGKKTQFSQQELSQLLQDCRQSSQQLSPGINNWLNSEEFRPVKDKLLEKLDPSEEIRVIIQGGEDRHRRLPWHLWDLFETYTKAEVALSLPEFEGTHKILPAKEKVRILAILGDSKGINLKPDREVLQRIPGAEIEFLPKEPQGEVQRGDISDKLWEQDWDILFFAGHSSSQDGTGKIFINSKDYLTVEDVKRGLRKTIERGLRLAIFNSCDGLKLAEDLGDLQIPVTVVMREPVPDGVAQQFLKHFLTAFAGGKSLYMAVREARERMLDEGLEKEIPGGSWLPAIFQNPAVLPPSWDKIFKTGASSKAIEVFLSCADEDEDLRYELENHLTMLKRKGVIKILSNRDISPGAEFESEIYARLNTARVILLLISSYFLASENCYETELKRAMERYTAGEALVIPVILRPVNWKGERFGKLNPLPKNGKPVTSWPNRDEAFLNVAQGIQTAIEKLTNSLL